MRCLQLSLLDFFDFFLPCIYPLSHCQWLLVLRVARFPIAR